MNRVLIAAATLGLLVATPVHAAGRIKPGQFKLDAKLGYILVRVGPTQGKKLKSANLYFWRYDAARGDVRFAKKKDANPVPKGEDQSAFVGDRPFVPGPTTSTYLVSVTPGDWVIHGTETTALAMGSYRFAVRPGEITDIGTVRIYRDDGSADDPALKRHPVSGDIVADRAYLVDDQIIVSSASAGEALPELNGAPIVRVTLIPDARFTNRGGIRPGYLAGLLVNRAAGLDDPRSGDGAAMVAMVKAAKGDDELKTKPVVDDKPKVEKAGQGTKPAT